jgi:hypothetical protein
MDGLDAVFTAVTLLVFAAAACLLALAVRSAAPASTADERRFRPFKVIRVATYGSLVALQALLIGARQWEHWPALAAVDADGGACLALYLLTLVRRRPAADAGGRAGGPAGRPAAA